MATGCVGRVQPRRPGTHVGSTAARAAPNLGSLVADGTTRLSQQAPKPRPAHLHRQLAAVGVVQHAALEGKRLAVGGAVALRGGGGSTRRHAHMAPGPLPGPCCLGQPPPTAVAAASTNQLQPLPALPLPAPTSQDLTSILPGPTSGYTASPVCGDPARCLSIHALKRCSGGTGRGRAGWGGRDEHAGAPQAPTQVGEPTTAAALLRRHALTPGSNRRPLLLLQALRRHCLPPPAAAWRRRRTSLFAMLPRLKRMTDLRMTREPMKVGNTDSTASLCSGRQGPGKGSVPTAHRRRQEGKCFDTRQVPASRAASCSAPQQPQRTGS